MALLKVKTQAGWVEGLPSANQMISVFKGVPYAKPPVGELRWQAPQPLEPWEGVRKCYKFAPIPPQQRMVSEGGGAGANNEFYVIDFPMSEDCLYMNIWTPANSADEKLPVSVYFHGGGAVGYGSLQAYDGDGFSKRGVIFIEVDFRIGMFGLLAHPLLTAEDPNHTSGNMEILDHIAALQWVRDNIAAFGGDPDNVTIFGQSAGGSCVRNLCLTPLSKGLFKRAILQSAGDGPVAPPSTYWEQSLERCEKLGEMFFEYCGCTTLEEMRAIPTEQMLELAINFIGKFDPSSTLKRRDLLKKAWTFNVDGYVFPKSPLELFNSGEYHDIDYMCGCTQDEYLTYTPQIPPMEAIRSDAEFYYGDKADAFIDILRLDEPEYAIDFFRNVMGDAKLAGNLALCELQLEKGRRPVYTYYFTLTPPGAQNAHHSAEHHYVFQTFVRSKRPYTGKDFDLSNMMCDYWTNFIKCGNPNGENLPKWTPYTEASPLGLEFKYEPEMINIPEKANVAFRKDFALGRIK